MEVRSALFQFHSVLWVPGGPLSPTRSPTIPTQGFFLFMFCIVHVGQWWVVGGGWVGGGGGGGCTEATLLY